MIVTAKYRKYISMKYFAVNKKLGKLRKLKELGVSYNFIFYFFCKKRIVSQ